MKSEKVGAGGPAESKTAATKPTSRRGKRTLALAPIIPLLLLIGLVTTQLTKPAPTPPARSNAGMTYDPIHQYVLLFGGHDGNDYLGDTWSWDGQRWKQFHPSTHPDPPLHKPVLVYDPASRHVLAFDANGWPGGASDFEPQVWAWDGSNWIGEWWSGWGGAALPDSNHPPLIVADPQLGAIVAILRLSPSTSYGAVVSKWNGKQWQEQAALEPPLNPDPVVAMAWAPGRQQLVIVSENSQGSECGGLLSRYIEPSEPPVRLIDSCANYAPPAESPTSVCTDGRVRVRLAVLVIGVTGRGTIPNTGLPCGWTDEQLVSDPTSGSLLVVGSTAQWALTGNRWIRTALVPDLQQRTGAAIADDSVRGQVVLFGGRRGGSPSNDTWIWDGYKWQRHGGNPPPPAPEPTGVHPRPGASPAA